MVEIALGSYVQLLSTQLLSQEIVCLVMEIQGVTLGRFLKVDQIFKPLSRLEYSSKVDETSYIRIHLGRTTELSLRNLEKGGGAKFDPSIDPDQAMSSG